MAQHKEDTEQNNENRPAIEGGFLHGNEFVQPFRLVKYFSLTGFIVILVFTLVLSFIISEQAKTVVLKKSGDYALLLANNLNHQVFLQFVLPAAMRYGRIRLRDPVQLKLLDAVVRNTIHGFKVKRVNIYDLEGNITYSTDEGLIGAKGADTAAYEDALKGKHSSTLITRPGPGLAGLERVRVLRTFFPFRGEKPVQGAVGLVLGVFEIFQDLSDDYAKVTKFQYLSFAISLVFTSVLFLILRQILVRAENIIEKRNEERRRLEEKLHHSERLAELGQMISAVAHEIRNPLGIISSTAEILQTKLKAYEPDNRLSDIILEESRRLNGIVTEFLDFARPQVPRPEPCSLKDILEKNLLFLAPSLDKESIEVVKNFKGPESIEADPDLLYRAFLNVFMNAVQAMPEGGQITVSTSIPYGRDGQHFGQAQVVIADTGKGIDPDQADAIFTPFFTTKNRGSGLGLAIVKNIVEEHKGWVAVEPGPESGTRVIIRLPLSQD